MKETKIFAIVNVTPDSFSGDNILEIDKILAKINQFTDEGASIIDVGAESTRPGATPISAEEEWLRIGQVLQKIVDLKKQRNFKISVDTRHYQTAKKALNLECDIINDVSGFVCEKMIDVIKNNDCQIVVMHNLGVPADKNKIIPLKKNVTEEVYNWAEQKISALMDVGVAKKRIIFDCGIGFGKNTKQSWQLLKNIEFFKKLDVKLLVGHSRKSFLANLANDKEIKDRDLETAIVSGNLAAKGIDYVRVHNVKDNLIAIKTACAF